MHSSLRVAAVLLLSFSLACGDDDAGVVDSGTRADAPVAQDTGMAVDAPAMEDAGTDAGGGEDAPAMVDAGPVTCFPLSGPSADLPDAIPSSFTAASPTWMRPTGEECPATMLGDVAVPFDTVCYENDTGADIDVLFEMLVGEEDLRPAVVIYDGTAIPSDAMGCAAVSSDLVIDAAEAFYTVPDGAMITFVATVQEPGTGDFQFVITPE